MPRVAITGQGTINPLGKSVAETYDAFKNGTCGISELEMQDIDRLSIKIGGQIKGFDAEEHFSRQEISLYDRYTQLAILAAKEAIGNSGIDFEDELSESSGVVIGTAGGGLTTQDNSYRSVYEERKNRVHPFVVPRLMNNAAASNVSMVYNLQGPTFSVATACASSNHAIGVAYQLIKSGMAKCMIAGGSECMICFGGIKVWESLRVMSPEKCRPFSKNRNGMVLGEGAALFILEDWDHAKARGADIIAEIVGFSMTSDAKDIVAPTLHGPVRAIRGALDDAQINPDDIKYINAHGTGTTINDRVETAVIREVFGVHADRVMVSSTKSMHGHLIGSTGAVELLACTMALREGIIAPTISYEEFDPECNLDIVPNTARDCKIETTVSNAFAFGGLNAVLVLKSTT
ncbi:MAG: beta-ketoacyl-[acyl-carrier-protein] synthase family protein [Rhodobacteraceae bacterium]|nr:beta-ketoacyl-[acyl-carrier-protein] synthase family protein [Paracoccaceae bacterium]MYF47004.1 beta-ketoacyl-[acyl-carrier-protein] synthase family protein [Paracoccaceae bacterium]MYI91160.1 beta-ketoacyl-[acyl-carrier-protein] synthase family protein [Paracoccaceae bacterium]